MKPIPMGLSGIVATGAGVGGYYFYSRPSKENTIKSKLSHSKLISSLPLNGEEMKKQWQAEFELDKNEIKKVIANISGDDKGGEILSKWCDDNLSESAREPLLTQVKKWCIAGTIESKIKKGKQFLTENDEEWENIWERHNTGEKRQKIGVTQTKSAGTKDNDIIAIKKFCNDNKKKIFLAKEKVATYDEVMDWCVK